ncbi:MAG: hypothetical protein LWW97_12395 [Deltaproteobacteria bacterium]|nr:hypothetical protein [Deltaproteobacteria bacterium]
MQRDEYTNPSKPEDNNKNYNYGFEGGYKFNFLTTELNIGADYVYRGANYNNQYGKHYRNDYATVDFYSKYRLFGGYLTIEVDNIFNEEMHISGDMSSTSTNRYAYYGFDRLFKINYEITF